MTEVGAAVDPAKMECSNCGSTRIEEASQSAEEFLVSLSCLLLCCPEAISNSI